MRRLAARALLAHQRSRDTLRRVEKIKMGRNVLGNRPGANTCRKQWKRLVEQVLSFGLQHGLLASVAQSLEGVTSPCQDLDELECVPEPFIASVKEKPVQVCCY